VLGHFQTGPGNIKGLPFLAGGGYVRRAKHFGPTGAKGRVVQGYLIRFDGQN
jgi:hypothetical protein